jgi:RND family efflux transporter MFP subunit
MRVITRPSNSSIALFLAAVALAAVALTGCSGPNKVAARNGAADIAAAPSVGVTPAVRKPIARQLVVSSELVPYQEIEVYAKESGFVKDLNVDYGSHVKKNDLIATLEIPELEVQIKQDEASIQNQSQMVSQAEHQLNRVEAQQQVYHLQYTRLKGVSDAHPGMVAQQEVDDSEGKDLAAQAQVEAARSAWQSAKSELEGAKARKERDSVLYQYSKITAPFSGVVTQRYANLGTLVQAGTSSSTNVLPIVKLSQDDRFRLVIPVPESYVKFIHLGDPVNVHVPSLDRTFPGRVARFSVDVAQDTRTMHTEVDVLNPSHVLIPGLYADATLLLERKNDALCVPVQAINHEATGETVAIVTSENQIGIRPVRLGLQSESWAEIVSGLKEGDQVVVSDRGGLKPGQSVQPHTVETTEYKPEG